MLHGAPLVLGSVDVWTPSGQAPGGLDDYETDAARTVVVQVGRRRVRALGLDRVLAQLRASGDLGDRARVPAVVARRGLDALITSREDMDDSWNPRRSPRKRKARTT